MADLISRAAAIDAIFGCFNVMESKGIDMTVARMIVKGVLDGVPAVDAVPVVHGRWIDENPDDSLDPRMRCSICTAVESPLIKWRYCPNCGAKMDGERRESECQG